MKSRLPIYISAVLLVSLVLCGCAHYRPYPLPTAPDLAKTPQLTVPVRQFWLPGLAPHPVPANGLDETTVVMLAVFNNPDLKAARLRAGVAGAQVFAAGLLPDPQFAAGAYMAAVNYGGDLGLSEEIRSWITRGAARAAAAAAQKQVNLDILWQEEQVAAQAQQLFVQIRAGSRLRAVYAATDRLLAAQYRRDHTAMERGDATSTAVSSELVALSDAETALRQLESQADLARRQLNALLGLDADVQLHLIGPAAIAPLTPTAFHAAIASLPRRRADLLALQAGYQSQEENVRLAVLRQFPALSLGAGFDRELEVEPINGFGPAATLSLPIFNRNRGQIAVQRATRAVLRQTYQARLDAAVSQAGEVWGAARIEAAQLRDLNARLPLLRQTAAAAERSLERSHLNATAYVSLESGYLAKEAQAIQLEAALESEQSALRLLLGLPFAAH
jgi:outer membrane protein TolC